MGTQYFCDNKRRAEAVDDHLSINGIEYLEVLDQEAIPLSSPRQQTLLVRCFKEVPASLDADNVVITDAVDLDVLFDATFNGGNGIQIVNPGTAVACAADGNAADGCELAGNNLTIGAALPITVTQGTSMVITYRVTIP